MRRRNSASLLYQHGGRKRKVKWYKPLSEREEICVRFYFAIILKTRLSYKSNLHHTCAYCQIWQQGVIRISRRGLYFTARFLKQWYACTATGEPVSVHPCEELRKYILKKKKLQFFKNIIKTEAAYTDLSRLTTGILSEICVVMRLRCCASVYLHKPT